MGRLVDADKLMTELMDSDLDHLQRDDWKEVIQIVQDAPTVPQWIPVTERLPKDDEEVIVSCTDDSGDSKFTYTTVGWHYKGLWVVNNDRCFFVVAWMPLPKPYKEGGK